MAQLINKDALVAEIESKIEKLRFNLKICKTENDRKTINLYIGCYNGIISLIDTLEVKEVDLEKEAELIANGIMIGVQANKYNTVVYNTKRNDFNHSHLMLAARKGIEFGLKMHKNEI